MSAQVRCAGCVWLLSLVSYTGKHPKLMPLLPDIQEAFSHLLGDQNELTQEMASRGMSVVYSLGDESAQKQLLDGLMGVLQGTVPLLCLVCQSTACTLQTSGLLQAQQPTFMLAACLCWTGVVKYLTVQAGVQYMS